MSGITYEPFYAFDTNDEDGDIIENHNGDILFISPSSINIREGFMSLDFSKPPTLGAIIGLCITMLVATAGIGWAFFSMIHGDISEIRTEISSVRDGAGDDTSKLREDNRQDFDNINHKLDKLTDMITDLRVSQAQGNRK